MIPLLLAVALSWSAHSEYEREPAAYRAQAAQNTQRSADSAAARSGVESGNQQTAAQQQAERVDPERSLAWRTYRLNAALVAATVLTLLVLTVQSFLLWRDVTQKERHGRIQLRAYMAIGDVGIDEKHAFVTLK